MHSFLSITFAMLAIAVSTATAQKRDITADFKDANFLREVRREIRKPTGAIYDTDVAKIGYLFIYNKGIASLAGIEHFKGLVYLDVSGNKLTSINVSNNPKLKAILCSRNKLTSIDVSKNPRMDWIECPNNMLTNIDLSKNPLMYKIWLHNNQITEIDLSKNPRLNELWMHNNKLSSLDVSNNPKLEELNCSKNELTSLDLSNNPELRRVYCSGNPLASFKESPYEEITKKKYQEMARKRESEKITYISFIDLRAKDINTDNGFRSKQEILQVIDARISGIRNLHREYLKSYPGFKGTVTLKFTITADGNISNINVVSSTTDYTKFDDAVENMVSAWRWKFIESGNTTVTVPFKFK
jgi:TonB family protein